ncbi:hypothetical protein LCGC14_2784160 [marine sediment metagenome]|uniref:Uncharacterized protein n=1 Tax=marine sediment metagenome TaxID=412755 RepID=A0A0F8YSH4_9ZZZZ
MTYTVCSLCDKKIPYGDRRYVVTRMEGSEQTEHREYCSKCFWLMGMNE